MTPTEVKKWPAYLTEKVEPATTMHFVAFIVDKAGKYGPLAKVELSSQELVYADIAWVEPFTTNLVDGTLKNKTTFEFTPATEGEAASYKYVWQSTKYYNYYEGLDDVQMANEIFFSTSAETVTAEELVDGKILIEDHSYGDTYYFAVIPIDADGAPGSSAAIFEYSCDFALENVATEGAEFDATMPEITINLPEEFYADGASGDAPYYGYKYENYYKKYQFYYEFNYVVKPVEGTTVSAVLVNAADNALEADAVGKASQVWQGSLGSYYTIVATEETEGESRYFIHYEDEAAPNVYLCVSWTDADGNYYDKEYALQAELQKLADKMDLILNHSPYRKQYSFDWVTYAQMMGLESMPACIDMGLSQPNYFMAGIDYEAVYGPEAAGMWMAGMEGAFVINPTNETSGEILLIQTDPVTGDTVPGPTMTYSNYTETSCTFNCPEILIENVTGTLMTETVTVQSQGIAM